jgi:hypothetical protein
MQAKTWGWLLLAPLVLRAQSVVLLSSTSIRAYDTIGAPQAVRSLAGSAAVHGKAVGDTFWVVQQSPASLEIWSLQGLLYQGTVALPDGVPVTLDVYGDTLLVGYASPARLVLVSRQSGSVVDSVVLPAGVQDLQVTRSTPPYVLVALSQGPVLRYPLSTLVFPDTLLLQNVVYLFLHPTLVNRVYGVSETGWLYEADPLTRAVLDSVHVGAQGGPGVMDAFQYIYVGIGPRLIRVDGVSFSVVDTPLTLADPLTALHFADPEVWGGTQGGTVFRWNTATLQGGVAFSVPEGVVELVYRTATGVAEFSVPGNHRPRLILSPAGWILRFPSATNVTLWRADGRRMGSWHRVRKVSLGRIHPGVYVLDMDGIRSPLLIP